MGDEPARHQQRTHHAISAMEENVSAIRTWEHAARHNRTRTERVSDWITARAASGAMQLAHVLWFGFWIAANSKLIPGISPFDPYPFQLLTMMVSLEAIFLSLFVLSSQNRLTHQTDKREHLDLQIDLLAEREMTVVLGILQDIAAHLNVKETVTREQIRDLVKKTDLRQLTSKVERELSEEEDLP